MPRMAETVTKMRHDLTCRAFMIRIRNRLDENGMTGCSACTMLVYVHARLGNQDPPPVFVAVAPCSVLEGQGDLEESYAKTGVARKKRSC